MRLVTRHSTLYYIYVHILDRHIRLYGWLVNSRRTWMKNDGWWSWHVRTLGERKRTPFRRRVWSRVTVSVENAIFFILLGSGGNGFSRLSRVGRRTGLRHQLRHRQSPLRRHRGRWLPEWGMRHPWSQMFDTIGMEKGVLPPAFLVGYSAYLYRYKWCDSFTALFCSNIVGLVGLLVLFLFCYKVPVTRTSSGNQWGCTEAAVRGMIV